MNETEKIVLEPQDHLVFGRQRRQHLLLLEKRVAHSQKVVLMRFGQESGTRRDPCLVFADGTGDQRLAERNVFAGETGLPRHRRRDVAVVDVNHGRHRNPIQ